MLSRLYPSSRRIDGKGGDGGRDVQIRDQDGHMDAFELKSFTGRMTNSRRRQVGRSLKRAAGLNPRRWILVVPIDPTPLEEVWFDRLGEDYDFPCEWLGKTWLNDKMSAHPDIRKYFCEHASDEVLDLLREINQEEAKVTNVADAVGRLERLRERLNEVDPYYRYELSTGASEEYSAKPGAILSVTDGSTRVDVFEKYTGAAKDRPITASVEFTIGPDEEALLEGVQSAFDYGLPVTIPPDSVSKFVLDAPAGLGGTFSGGELSIRSVAVALDDPLTLTLKAMEGDDLRASYSVHFTKKTGGGKGFILDGSDTTGWLQVRLKVNPSAQEFHATFKLTPGPANPAALVPLVRFLGACRPPYRLTITWPEGLEMSSELETSLGDERFAAVVEALAYLQEESGVYFPMPLELPPESEQVILNRAAILREGQVKFTWAAFSLTLKRGGPGLEPLLEGLDVEMVVERDECIELDEGTIPIGRIRTEIEAARAVDPKGVRAALASGVAAEVQMVPGGSNRGRNLLVV